MRTKITEVDRQVGARVRMRRLELGVTQTELGDAIGRTYQQVQKHEYGNVRLSAGRLFLVAQALQRSVSFFFEEMVRTDLRPTMRSDDRSRRDLITNFENISSSPVRLAFLKLVQSLSEHGDAQD